MDRLPESFGYRCLPLNIANMHGWEIYGARAFTARWDGGGENAAIQIEDRGGQGILPTSHFGFGVLTFQVPMLFRTEPGINLFVMGPPNEPKHGICALSGVVETDWSPFSFTMNWKFTAPHVDVVWEPEEPYAFIFPIPRELIETAEPEIRPLDDDPELAQRFRTWYPSRVQFNQDLRKPGSDASRTRWQKHYYRGRMFDDTEGPPDHRIKLRVKPWKK
jgi:hypothetical protein